jgi:hypothetical protein
MPGLKPILNLTGQRFGKLVAVERVPTGHWRCQCDCGNESLVTIGNLRSGNTRSCGCGRLSGLLSVQEDRVMRRWAERDSLMIGKRFGKLIVLRQLRRPEFARSSVAWECQCDCGNKVVRQSSYFTPAVRKRVIVECPRSCGCLDEQNKTAIVSYTIERQKDKRVKSRARMLNGRFGRLVVESRADDDTRYGRVRDQWNCRCDCGKVCVRLGMLLRRGGAHSCGCLKANPRRQYKGLPGVTSLVGQRFGRGVVLSWNPTLTEQGIIGRHGTEWVLRCDCGQTYTALTNTLTSGARKSCGCARRDYYARGKSAKSLEGPDSVPADSRSNEADGKTACR